MKKTFIPFAMMALVMGMYSCSNDNDNAGSLSQYIAVSTDIATMTRMATANDGTQSFTDGDQISIYAWTGDAATVPTASNRVVDNAVNTLTSGTWTATPQMLWKNTADDHYFIGIYPKNDASVVDLTAGDYTLDVDDQAKSDLLVATNTKGLKSVTNPVPLTFNHVMAKLKVTLQFRNQWGGTPAVESVTLKAAATTAKVNYLTQAVTASATTGDIALPVVDANKLYTSIVIPQTSVKSIVISIDGKKYTYTNPSGITLESGKITSVSLTVGRNEITLGEVTVRDWQTGSTIADGEAQE